MVFEQVFQQGQGDGAVALQGITVERINECHQLPHVAGVVHQQPGDQFRRQGQAQAVCPGVQGAGTFVVGQQVQAECEIPGQARSDVFPQGERTGCVAAGGDQREAVCCSGLLVPLIVQGEQGSLLGRVQRVDIVDGNQAAVLLLGVCQCL